VSAPDHYDIYYADKLWSLLPAVYRADDTDQFDHNGPLREMVNRIDAQAAILRRRLDRMWEDQSIETCDDWVIPYIGDLLATNLVAGLDARGQRLDVAKTIYYRRRKGTAALLEELAADITGWDAKVVEFFRRMGRTRHGLDPPIGATQYASGDLATLQFAEGLVGPRTRTGIGGFADLRNAYGAAKAHTAFDEFFHTADMRAGLGGSGWYNIPRLGVFLWRLKSYPVGPVAPVPVHGCPGWYTFDPTGRDIPLFAAGRTSDAFGSQWVSPTEAELPTPISQNLLGGGRAGHPTHAALYADGGPLAIYLALASPPADDFVDPAELVVRPERGRFQHLRSPPAVESNLLANYHYGFSSDIGAGPYDRRGSAVATPSPSASTSGGGPLTGPQAVPRTGTFTLGDSLTYVTPAEVTVGDALTLRAGERQRPLIRLQRKPPAPWRFIGGLSSKLTLDGLMVSGGDIVLAGQFDSVTISCCTLDPGSAGPAGSTASGSPPSLPFAIAADEWPLVPTRLWVEATITNLLVDRSIVGPVRTRAGGTVGTLTISNSIIQAIPTGRTDTLLLDDVKDQARLELRLWLAQDLRARKLRDQDPVAARLIDLSPAIGNLLGSAPPASPPSSALMAKLVQDLDKLIAGQSIYDQAAFAAVPLSAATIDLLGRWPASAPAPELNLRLLKDAFPLELDDAALALADGIADLSRCTMLGRVIAHRLRASECILQDLAEVDDTQDGCVRFTAYAQNSVLPRKFESVAIAQRALLFTSIEFGQPGYGQLLPLVDAAILPQPPTTGPQNTISAGAEDGSEMGAFARDKNPAKLRGLLLKYQEFMPAGLVPVTIFVT
jgi:hypothetical protein